MNRRSFVSQSLAVGLMTASFTLLGSRTAKSDSAKSANQQLAANELIAFRSSSCSCCGDWVAHMTAAGFQVQERITEDMDAVKQRYGVPENMASCHTAIVGGYVVEGHVPASDVQRLLAERPAFVGLAAPGMPVGSPGMESAGPAESYTVFAFTQTGSATAFAEHL